MNTKETAKAIKEIVALGKAHLDELNRELVNCNIHIVYNTASSYDYDNPENARGDND